MNGIPLSALSLTLLALLVLSGLFSMAETSMMAANRYRLRHLADQGHRGARLAVELIGQTDKMLGVILLGNNLLNAAAATLVSIITIELFGEETWALGAATLAITFAILVVSEITPKIIGAAHADRLAIWLAFVLWPLLRAVYPVVWFINLFASGLLGLLRIKQPEFGKAPGLTAEELRAVVLESAGFIPGQHRDILVNLFELERVTVEDIMVPRGEIESIDIEAPIEQIRAQLATGYHTRLPVVAGDPGNVIGILHQRRLLPAALNGPLDVETLRGQLAEPYFIPATTPAYAQLQFFRENRQRQGLVVDEYGEILGLVTLEDIIEEIVGKFTTSMPGASADSAWQEDGTVLVDGSHSLRELNRLLGLQLPLDGPKTLSGLIVESLRDIPETDVCLRIADVPMEIVQTQDRRIKIVKLFRPSPTGPAA
jgi:Mg2+/Co2+ transporter CorB